MQTGQATKIDRLAFSFREQGAPVERLIERMFRHVGQPTYHYQHGAHGFLSAAEVTVGGAQVAWWAWGGSAQRGRAYVDMSGLGCQLVKDWSAAVEGIQELPAVKLRRADIALDFYRGEVRYENVEAAYKAGKFNRGGRTPTHSQWLTDQGRTFYVGQRTNDVYFRAYEKGIKELGSAKLGAMQVAPQLVCVGGEFGLPFKFRDWFRLELELKAKKRPLTFDVVSQSDQYFAGAYPYLQEVLPDVEPVVMVTPRQVAEANLNRSLAMIRQQWGSTLYTAITVYEGDVCGLWPRICGTEHNERLVRAGVLLPQDGETEVSEGNLGRA